MQVMISPRLRAIEVEERGDFLRHEAPSVDLGLKLLRLFGFRSSHQEGATCQVGVGDLGRVLDTKKDQNNVGQNDARSSSLYYCFIIIV